MSVPPYDQFIDPILRFLASQSADVHARDAAEYAAKSLGLSEEDRQQILPSGIQPIYKNRAGWAHDRLKRAGLSLSVKRGYWRITEEGKKFCAQNPSPLSKAAVEKIATGYKTQNQFIESNIDESTITMVSPDERLGQAIQEIRKTTEDDLLELLHNTSPGFFESIVLDLLHKMGYGTDRSDIQKIGNTGDGGIDGIISLDRLGLEKVYVQAKRWQGSVGRPELQAFYGALAGQKSKKGVIITTSSFTAQAIGFAQSVEGIVLIDGKRLAGLMIDYEIGITSKTIRVPKIDSDYFDE